MLSSLSIKNYALIEDAHIALSEGFTVITGETGAGKSILLGALGLITGKRADLSSVGNPERKCIIEGVFSIKKYELQPFFEAHDLDYDSHSIIRREILPSGKSRAFINDTPVTLQQLGALGAQLIDIHSQHSTMAVTSRDYQFEIIDSFAALTADVKSYASNFRDLRRLQGNLKKLRERKEQSSLELDYKSFLFQELEETALKPNEFEALEEQLKTLAHAEEIQENLALAFNKISQSDASILEHLGDVRASLQKISSYSKEYEGLYDRVNSVFIELDDVSETLETEVQEVVSDPLMLEQVNNRLQLLYNLMKKHQVSSTEELIALREQLDLELGQIHNVDHEIEQLEQSIKVARTSLQKQAKALHEGRLNAAPQLKSAIEQILKEVGMENAILDISITSGDQLLENGSDSLEFLFSANKGSSPKPIGKAASGGELSRVMLAVKSVLSTHKNLPTLLFDEIDTGVSGEVALKMGGVLRTMGQYMQLISITHLPQIAGQGTSHLKVYKRDTASKTITEISSLDQDARIVEIANMLGGTQHGNAALEHAKNLLN